MLTVHEISMMGLLLFWIWKKKNIEQLRRIINKFFISEWAAPTLALLSTSIHIAVICCLKMWNFDFDPHDDFRDIPNCNLDPKEIFGNMNIVEELMENKEWLMEELSRHACCEQQPGGERRPESQRYQPPPDLRHQVPCHGSIHGANTPCQCGWAQKCNFLLAKIADMLKVIQVQKEKLNSLDPKERVNGGK